jgi:hypothetical protein
LVICSLGFFLSIWPSRTLFTPIYTISGNGEGQGYTILPVYSLFGDGEGRGYTVRLSFDICQSHHQESAARMPQIFDHRSMLVSHTTRNLRHKCRRFSIIDQCLSVTPPGICGTNAAEYFSICQLFVI